METVGESNIRKFCNFYVSDVHLSVMLLPYLSKQINEDVKITTIFEKLDKENIEKILDKLNVKIGLIKMIIIILILIKQLKILLQIM